MPDSAEVFQEDIAAGNLRRAGAWLVEHCARDVMSLCTAMVRDPATAEDLAQEAFGKAFSSLQTFRGEASPRTWLLAIARNQCLDHLRRQKMVRQVESHDSDASDEAASDAPLPAELLGNRTDVARALASLDELQRAMVVLRFCQGSSYDELAVVFGITPGTARMRVSRALGRMREVLSQSALDGGRAAGARSVASPPPAPSAPRASQARAEQSARSVLSRLIPGGRGPTAPPAAAPPPARSREASVRGVMPAASRGAMAGPPAPPGADVPSMAGAGLESAFAAALAAHFPALSAAAEERLALLAERLA